MPDNQKHSCWLSAWLSTLSQQFYLFRRLWVEASDGDDRLPLRRLTGSSTWSSTPANKSTIRTPSVWATKVETADRNVHSPVLKGTHLRPVEAGEIREFVLRPPSFRTKVTNARTQPPLNLFTLQQEQFRGILLKRILLNT
jgi:hypothetical protein